MTEARRVNYNAYMRKWYAANKHRIPKRTPEQVSWGKMRQRCNDPNSNRWQYYGGRGVRVLYASFAEFIADVGPRPGEGYSVDRIDTDGHYRTGNCRWATVLEQRHNRRDFKCL